MNRARLSNLQRDGSQPAPEALSPSVESPQSRSGGTEAAGSRSRRCLVKICGIGRIEEGEAAASAGADYVSFNFYPKSPRYVDPHVAARIAAALPTGIRRVGVFVNPRREEVERVLHEVGVEFVQFSGDEPAQSVLPFASRAIKAFRLESAPGAEFFAAYGPLHAYLLDASVQGAYGGTGRTLSWSTATGFGVPRPFWIAGGLTAENVGEAIAAARPDGVDVASGVEDQPGRKSAERIYQFLRAVREAERG